MKELIEKRPSEAMERLKPYESLPFRYEFDAFESNIKQSDKKWIPSQAEYLPLQNVDVRNPHCRFIWMTYPSQGFAVLGRIVCEGGMQHVAGDYSLKKEDIHWNDINGRRVIRWLWRILRLRGKESCVWTHFAALGVSLSRLLRAAQKCWEQT